MKDFNLDQLERKNIYKTPEFLFERVQENVLKNVSSDIKTEEPKPARLFKMNWTVGIAAAFIAIFGMLWFMNTNNDNTSIKIDSIVKAEVPHTAEESKQAYSVLKSDMLSTETEENTQGASIKTQPVADNSVKKNYPTEINTAPKKENTVSNTKLSEEQMNAYIDAFPKGEVAELASNSVSDVYLDLYN